MPDGHVVPEWEGGERYGDERDLYYAEYRGTVRGARPGDTVEVWFTAVDRRRGHRARASTSPTRWPPTAAPTCSCRQRGLHRRQPDLPGRARPRRSTLDEYVAALDANGVSVRHVGRRRPGRAPPPRRARPLRRRGLGPGDNRLTQDPEDELTDTFLFGPLPDLAVAERQQYLTLAVRDYLNEGGKLSTPARRTRLLRPARRLDRRHLLRARRRSRGRTASSPRTSSATACCWPTTSPSTTWAPSPARRSPARPASPAPGAARRRRGRLRRAGRRRQPARRGRRVRADQRRAAARPVPAVRRAQASSTYLGAGGVNPFGPVEGERYAGAPCTRTPRTSGSAARST